MHSPCAKKSNGIVLCSSSVTVPHCPDRRCSSKCGNMWRSTFEVPPACFRHQGMDPPSPTSQRARTPGSNGSSVCPPEQQKCLQDRCSAMTQQCTTLPFANKKGPWFVQLAAHVRKHNHWGPCYQGMAAGSHCHTVQYLDIPEDCGLLFAATR